MTDPKAGFQGPKAELDAVSQQANRMTNGRCGTPRNRPELWEGYPVSLLSRSIVAGTAGIALMGLAACGAHGPSGLANLDPCKIMNPQQLGADGLDAQGIPNNNLGRVPGCTFKNLAKEVTFFESQTQTVDSYQQAQPWQNYAKTTINGRPAARAEADGAAADGNCDMLMDAGGGMVLVDVRDPAATGDQACDEALKYSQQIEPTLPK